MRHGATPWNVANRFQGMTETSINEDGQENARNNAQLLSNYLERKNVEPRAVSVHCSPLLRAQQSAKIIANSLSSRAIVPIIHKEFREISMGHWEGMQNLEVKEKHYEERKRRKADRWNFAPIGGESLQDRSAEVMDCIKTMPSCSVIITHAGIIRIIQHFLGGHEKQSAAAFHMPHEGLLIWESDKTHFLG